MSSSAVLSVIYLFIVYVFSFLFASDVFQCQVFTLSICQTLFKDLDECYFHHKADPRTSHSYWCFPPQGPHICSPRVIVPRCWTVVTFFTGPRNYLFVLYFGFSNRDPVSFVGNHVTLLPHIKQIAPY